MINIINYNPREQQLFGILNFKSVSGFTTKKFEKCWPKAVSAELAWWLFGLLGGQECFHCVARRLTHTACCAQYSLCLRLA